MTQNPANQAHTTLTEWLDDPNTRYQLLTQTAEQLNPPHHKIPLSCWLHNSQATVETDIEDFAEAKTELTKLIEQNPTTDPQTLLTHITGNLQLGWAFPDSEALYSAAETAHLYQLHH